MAAEGLTTLPSNFGPKETVERLAAEINARDMTVFARIDHQAGLLPPGLLCNQRRWSFLVMPKAERRKCRLARQPGSFAAERSRLAGGIG